MIKPSSSVQHHSRLQTARSLSISCKFLHTPGPVATIEESSDSDRAASHLLANLNLQIALKHSMSTLSLSSSLYFGSTDDQSYSSSSANISTPLTSSSLSKQGHGTTADKIKNDFTSASQNLSDYLQVSGEERVQYKHAQRELDLLHIKEKSQQHDSKLTHKLCLQRERQAHEASMKDKDIETLQIQLQIEKLRTERVAMEWGAGGETQDSL